jgi:hypothetical protein
VLALVLLVLLSDPTAPAIAANVLAGAIGPRAPPALVDVGILAAVAAATAVRG